MGEKHDASSTASISVSDFVLHCLDLCIIRKVVNFVLYNHIAFYREAGKRAEAATDRTRI